MQVLHQTLISFNINLLIRGRTWKELAETQLINKRLQRNTLGNREAEHIAENAQPTPLLRGK